MSFKKPETVQAEAYSLMCVAHGCPMRWSVEPRHLCSYHAWEEPNKWPAITEALNRDGPWKLDRKPEIDTTKYVGDPLAWAKRLRDRDLAGEKLSPLQRSMYQAIPRHRLEEPA